MSIWLRMTTRWEPVCWNLPSRSIYVENHLFDACGAWIYRCKECVDEFSYQRPLSFSWRRGGPSNWIMASNSSGDSGAVQTALSGRMSKGLRCHRRPRLGPEVRFYRWTASFPSVVGERTFSQESRRAFFRNLKAQSVIIPVCRKWVLCSDTTCSRRR